MIVDGLGDLRPCSFERETVKCLHALQRIVSILPCVLSNIVGFSGIGGSLEIFACKIPLKGQ